MALVSFFALLIGLPVLAAAVPSHTIALFDSFYRSGALVFGGGHVVLPLLQASVVPPGWVANDAFLAGYGAAQAVPGPLFTFAAYLGTVMGPPPNGWLGGLICLVAIFLPSFLLLIGALPFWDTLAPPAGRAIGPARRQCRGRGAAAGGALQAGVDERDFRTGRFRDRDPGLSAVGAVGGAAVAGGDLWRGRGDDRRRHLRCRMARVFCWLCACCCWVVPAARAAETVFLEELTWTELRDLIHAGKTTIIVPIGGTEQNGPHMALGQAQHRGSRYLSEKIARALGNALVAPVIAYVPEGAPRPADRTYAGFPARSPCRKRPSTKSSNMRRAASSSPGSATLSFSAIMAGYQKDEQAVADRLDKEWAAHSRCASTRSREYYRASESEFGRLLKSKGYREEEVGTHAGLADTSLTLAVDPRLVRTDACSPAAPATASTAIRAARAPNSGSSASI